MGNRKKKGLNGQGEAIKEFDKGGAIEDYSGKR